jgi:hypothetical protein
MAISIIRQWSIVGPRTASRIIAAHSSKALAVSNIGTWQWL